MNYLAHAYLSFHQPEIAVGNMISDFVKGKTKFDYSAGIQKGITLHRAIDEFTDSHRITHEAKQYFRPVYRLYSGAFIDIVYDHFLAVDSHEFLNSAALALFTKETYQFLLSFQNDLPASFRSIMPFMITHDWLYNYQYREGIQKSFEGLVRRSSYLHESQSAFEIFQSHYSALKSCYDLFFPLLKEFALQHLQLLKKE